MKTEMKNIKAALAAVGGALEEDLGYRGMRVWQLIAPAGQVWKSGTKHIRIELSSGKTPSDRAHNQAELGAARDQIRAGVVDIPDEDAELYAED